MSAEYVLPIANCSLEELGKTPVTVICAGVKSILDIGATLEVLETKGGRWNPVLSDPQVTVATYGPSKEFPAFYTRTSGFQSMINLKDEEEVAKVILANQTLGLQSGILIACPIPESDEISNPKLMKSIIQQALMEADRLGVKGKETTPFLLGKVKELTGGESLKANIALVENNARIGAKIAVAFHILSQRRSFTTINVKRPLIVGGSVLDILSTSKSSLVEMKNTSTIGMVRQIPGGVGRNIAHACHLSKG